MKKLRAYSRLIDAIGLSVGLLLCKQLADHLSRKDASSLVVFAVCLLVMLVMIRAFGWLGAEIVKGWTFLRRLLLRDDYIEGVWLGTSPADCALVVISIRDGDINVAGEQFDGRGNLRLTWSTLAAAYDGDNLRYLYQSRTAGVQDLEEVLGFATVSFVRARPNRVPVSYSGYFVDISTRFERLAFTGERISKRETLRRLESAEGKREFVIQALKQRPPAAAESAGA